MNSIRAVVIDPATSERLVLKEVPAPSPAPGEALIRVSSVSLNRGEVRRSTTAEAGWRPGWDLAGTVEAVAADGSGPQIGNRVVGFVRSGAWAEQVAVSTRALAPLPPSVSFAQAATLPVAGLTALLALERGGLLLGRRVLITGATGGVGYFGCQLANLAGAHVVAHVRQAAHEVMVRSAGAKDVAIGPDLSEAGQFGPFSVILESVGGAVLSGALGLLAPGGTCVLFGTSAGREVTFDASRLYSTGGASLYGFILFHELEHELASIGLARLVQLLAAGQLHTHIAIEAPWTEVAGVAERLMKRQFSGKAVLHLNTSS